MADYLVPANTPLNDDTVRALRADFPILNTVVNGNPLVYLDSGATSQNHSKFSMLNATSTCMPTLRYTAARTLLPSKPPNSSSRPAPPLPPS